MVTEMWGDLLRDGTGILCHQTNYQGVMGAGIARDIRERLLTEQQYNYYVEICKRKGDGLLGWVQFIPLDDGRMLANCFGENMDSDTGVDTDYNALRKCLEDVLRVATPHNTDVSMPGFIGCGLAGGDWNVVRQIIEDVFADSTVNCKVIYWEKARDIWGKML